MPFYYLYRRDSQAFTILLPAHQATVEPLPDISDAEFNYKDLDSNKEVLGPQLDENGDGQEATKQEYEADNNQFITSSTLTAANEAYSISSNIKNNSDQILTFSESSANKNSKSNSIILNLGTFFLSLSFAKQIVL